VQQLQGVVDVGVLDHDAVFWFGDLNYRIDMPVPQEEVFEKVASFANLNICFNTFAESLVCELRVTLRAC
jgi:hypothetical protein